MDVLDYGGTRLETYSRPEFLSDCWDYQAGQHCTILGPTGWGKTHWTLELLGSTARPELPSITYVTKPRDATIQRWAKSAGHKLTRQWPPPTPQWLTKRPPGYLLWPKHSFDSDRDDAMLASIGHKMLMDSYRRGNRIVNADEVAELDEIGLERDLVAIWKRGRSMGCGMWAGSQRPFDIPVPAYSSASHLFLGNDPDQRNRKRFDEIGGFDAGLVRDLVRHVPKYCWLYLHRDTRSICVVLDQ